MRRKLSADLKRGKLQDEQSGVVFADMRYCDHVIARVADGEPTSAFGTADRRVEQTGNHSVIATPLGNLPLIALRSYQLLDGVLTETISITNAGNDRISLDQVEFGFVANLAKRKSWRFCAVPFRVQLDGSLHDYSAHDLTDGKFKNAVMIDETRKFMPPLTEEGALRSEAWAWHDGERGLLIIKYSNEQIELSVARVIQEGGDPLLKFGGAGFALFGEPTGARALEPGQTFTFGSTTYISYEGPIHRAYEIYRDFLDARGHTFPADYNPPVNWNELYDIGWHHSDPTALKKFYTREALLDEAAKARDVGCDLLYLDPGWEVCEGITQWDEARLGTVSSLVQTLHEHGLELGYRTILRTYQDHWPHEWLIQHKPGPYEPVPFVGMHFWEPCLCNEKFWNEKLKRILAISKQGVKFMMVDEFDWRGPCHDPSHGHKVPTTALDHTLAVYRLCDAIRKACPGLTIECHDPVWPWATSIYVPTYLKQGFGQRGSYEENWGFEYMWDCLNDLKSGKALALYYYNLGCNIPLYLHITMAADNDACVFFWWCASTVRHLGIGGKTSNKTIEPPGGLPPFDPNKRFAAYKSQMKLYHDLKPYFVRGTFHGITEHAHLHTLPDRKGGVLNVFNLTDAPRDIEVHIPLDKLRCKAELPVHGATSQWTAEGATLRMHLAPMTPAVICIGDCTNESKGTS